MRLENGAGSFEVEEECEGLGWIDVKDAVQGRASVGMEVGGWILPVEDLYERTDI